MKVDFFIVGAPKAGTTSLYHYLNEHPQVEMSLQKEPDYFSKLNNLDVDSISMPDDMNDTLLKILSSPNISSKKRLYYRKRITR